MTPVESRIAALSREATEAPWKHDPRWNEIQGDDMALYKPMHNVCHESTIGADNQIVPLLRNLAPELAEVVAAARAYVNGEGNDEGRLALATALSRLDAKAGA